MYTFQNLNTKNEIGIKEGLSLLFFILENIIDKVSFYCVYL